jgi:hypothetical protein
VQLSVTDLQLSFQGLCQGTTFPVKYLTQQNGWHGYDYFGLFAYVCRCKHKAMQTVKHKLNQLNILHTFLNYRIFR